MDWTADQPTSVSFPLWVRVRFLPWIWAIVFLIVMSGCRRSSNPTTAATDTAPDEKLNNTGVAPAG